MTRSARKRTPLTRYFSVVSVVSMLTLGVALVVTTSQVMRDRALEVGIETAQTVESYAQRAVPLEAHTLGLLTPEERTAVGTSVDGFAGRLIALRLWTADGEMLYDSASIAPTGFPDGNRLDTAVRANRPNARMITDVQGDQSLQTSASTTQQVLDVYVPIAYGSVVVGAAEVVLDNSGTAATLARANLTITSVVVIGLLLVWLLLYRTVRTFSRRLQSTALDNARLALLDPLTGLPNRRMLLDRLARSVETATEEGTGVGLVVLDIDRFKDINDSLGHDMGDELLTQVALRLQGALRDDDLVARLGGDEFAVLLPSIHEASDAAHLADRVRGVFCPPFQLGEMELHVETSIGVACLPEHATDGSTLMRRADVAMYAAKVHRLGVAMYSPDEDDSSPARLVLLGDLHRALTRSGELVLHYQPKIDLHTGATVGVEALMRWQHPTRGMLPPTLFVPLAEQTGLINDLTKFALETAVAQIAAWRDDGEPLAVAVNLSAHNLTSFTVVDTIVELLAKHDVPPELLEVEITETALVADPSRIVPVLTRLDGMGIRVSIDDFGIGTTSISQLRDLPVAQLKIDQLFVSDLGSGAEKQGSEVVVQAMVDLAHSFGLVVIAEGVEDVRTASRLAALGVDQAQGFLYSKAVPADEVAAVRAALLPTQRPSPEAAGTRHVLPISPGGSSPAGDVPITTA
ncbi:putative bifunctional diguanylate cyclase/phosphodiesterase [Pengzhenrongella phosphoraccumulans]|uniref:putative bifunctional diguanylate cyclase/phosphodiesterase n=1 Tax=Pengzhenrongella phosphoraccumulans TaxID=3114394 RepID=UPI00388D519A